MCEDKGCDCKSHEHHHGRRHKHDMMHIKGYKSIVKRVDKEITVPDVLLEVAGVDVGDFLELSVRKVKRYENHHE